jgi:mycothiol synthase
MKLRTAKSSDTEKLAEIWNESVKDDNDFSPLSLQSWRELYSWPDMVLERDVCVAEEDEVWGYCALLMRSEDMKHALIRISGPFVHTRFRHRGAGHALMAWIIAEARLRGAREIQTWIPEERMSHEFLKDCGFSVVRYYFKMRASLDDIPVTPQPFSVEIIPFASGNEEMLLDVHNRGFAGGWDYSSFTMEELEEWKRQSIYDPEGIFLALHSGKAVGFCIVFMDREYVVNTGDRVAYVSDLACDPDYRILGIGSHLLSRAAMYARERGMEALELDVDADNPGALHVYESMGFRRKKKSVTYRRGV